MFYSTKKSPSSTEYGVAVFDATRQEHITDLPVPRFPEAPYGGLISVASSNGRLAANHFGGVTVFELAQGGNPLTIEGVSINTNVILHTKSYLFTLFGNRVSTVRSTQPPLGVRASIQHVAEAVSESAEYPRLN